MGSGRIKGITIEIGGNVTELNAALKSVDGQLSVTQAKLKDVNYLLKFNPSNVTLLTQKQSALKQAIEQSKQRTKELNTLLNQMKASGAPKEQIEALEREIIQSESKTKALQKQLRALGNPKLTALSTQFKAMGESIGNTGQKIKSVGEKFMPVTKAIGGVTVAAGGLIMKAASAGDRIDKMSQKVGLSRKSFQEMEFAMSQSGTKIESLQTGMKTMTKQMSGAANGTKSSAEAFKKLGVSVTDSNGNLRSQEEVMFETISALQGMKNQTEKAKIANQLFGRAGTELMPLLNEEAGSLDKMREKANKLGLVMGDDAVDASVNFTDTLDQLKRSLGVAAAKIGAALLPHVQKLANYVIQNMPQIQKFIQGVVDKITSISPATMKIVGIIAIVAAAIGPVLITIGSMVTAIGGLVTAIGWLFSPIGLFVAAIVGAIAATVLLVKNWNKVEAAAKQLWKNLQTSFTQIKTAIMGAWNAIKRGTSTVWRNIKTVVSNLVNAVWRTITSIFNSIKNTISTIWNAIKTVTSSIWNGIKTVIGSAVNWVRTTVSNVFSAVKSNVSNIWNGIKSTISNALSAAKTAVSNAVKAIKNFMKFDGVGNVVKAVFTKVKTFIQNGLKSAKTAVSNTVKNIKSLLKFSGVVSAVKSVFSKLGSTVISKVKSIISSIKKKFSSFKLKLPTPKLPKIELKTNTKTILGKKFTYPTGFSVSWNRDAMNLGKILSGASIFGMAPDGRFLGGGEAGQEVVVGKKSLLTMVRQASASGSAGMERRLANIERLLGRYLQADTTIVLDTGAVAGAVNRKLGVRW